MRPEDHVRQWLSSNQTGCAFATMLAKAKAGIAMAPFPGIATAEDLDSLFDFAAADRRPAVAVLPGVRTELELAAQLLALAGSPRWRVQRIARPASLVTDDVFIGLEWRGAELWSSPMGLAPLGTMPPTRRAPYACIAAWTGGRDNKFRKKLEPVVHFLDVDLSRYRSLDAEKYTVRRKASEKATTEIMGNDSANNYRNVAFRLSAATAQALSTLSG